jgi:hypothetical protein
VQNEDKYVICPKAKYRTEQDALFALNKIRETSSRKKVPIRVYQCGKCHCWHLTSTPNAIELVNENKILKEKIAELEKEIENLKDENKRKERLDIKINEEVKICKHQMKKLQDRIAKLRKDEQELIMKNVQLMKKIEELCQS